MSIRFQVSPLHIRQRTVDQQQFESTEYQCVPISNKSVYET